MAGQVRREVRRNRDRPHARAAAAVGDAEGLVQIDVAHVGADARRGGEAGERVEVGAVHVHLRAALLRCSQISRTRTSNTPCVEG